MSAYLPDAEAALSDLRWLASGPWRSEPEFLELLRSLVDEGTPILEIDHATASGADGRVIRYKIADRLKAFIVARLALDADAHEVKSNSSHSVGSSA